MSCYTVTVRKFKCSGVFIRTYSLFFTSEKMHAEKFLRSLDTKAVERMNGMNARYIFAINHTTQLFPLAVLLTPLSLLLVKMQHS